MVSAKLKSNLNMGSMGRAEGIDRSSRFAPLSTLLRDIDRDAISSDGIQHAAFVACSSKKGLVFRPDR